MITVGTIDLVQFNCDNYDASKIWLRTQLQDLRKDCFENNERIVILHQHDYYVNHSEVGLILKNLLENKADRNY